MEPLLVTGLVSLGKNVLDRVLPEVFGDKGIIKKTFDQFLKPSEAETSNNISNFLQANGVDNLSKLNLLKSKLGQELLKLSNSNTGNGAQLLLSEGDNFSLALGDGRQFELNSDPALKGMARLLHEINRMSKAWQVMPGANMSDLATELARQPQISASWKLA